MSRSVGEPPIELVSFAACESDNLKHVASVFIPERSFQNASP